MALVGVGLAFEVRCEPSSGAKTSPNRMGTSIQVIEGGWGSASPDDILVVLESVANVLVPTSGGRPPARIQVRHRFGTPMVSYDREERGEYSVFLTARNERWYQYAYQFAHELCHVVSRFDRKDTGEEIVRDNQWFEESLCEAASLDTLRRLSQGWSARHSEPRWGKAAQEFGTYADALLRQPHRQLPAGTGFADWFGAHKEALRAAPYQREEDELIATAILPLFEGRPGAWDSLACLNPDPGADRDFALFLSAWYRACPAELKPLVASIARMFGLEDPAISPDLGADPRPR